MILLWMSSTSAVSSTFEASSFFLDTKTRSAGHAAPSSIHLRIKSDISFGRGPPFFLGGISRSSSSGNTMVVYSGLLADLPGTSDAPLSPLVSACFKVCKRTPPLACFSLWQETQLFSKMGWTSFTKSTAARVAGTGIVPIKTENAAIREEDFIRAPFWPVPCGKSQAKEGDGCTRFV